MLISIREIMRLTDLTRKSVDEKLKSADISKIQVDGKHEPMVESRDALPVMFGISKKLKTLDSERTRLASAQADKHELELKILKGEALRASDVERELNKMFGAFRSKMLNLPVKAAPLVLPLADLNECETTIRDLVHEALQELHDYDPKEYSAASADESGGYVEAAAETNRKRVGRPKKKAVEGSKRRTRPVEH